MRDRFLDYETPHPDEVVARRLAPQAFVATGVFALAGVTGIALAGWDAAARSGGASIWVGIGCFGTAIVSLVTFAEVVLFPRNVSDRREALAASGIGILVASFLLLAWLLLPGLP